MQSQPNAALTGEFKLMHTLKVIKKTWKSK